MKKIFTLFAVILCATSAWAWCGNSFITVNGKWYTGSNSYKHEGGYFNDANLGDLTTLMLGGELQVYPKSGAAATLCYKIDDGGEKSISLPKTGEDGNNSKHSGSGKVDLSALSGGEHTISVWFKHNSDYDSNNSKNFVAKFNIPATAPDRYITGTIAGGWDGNEVKMTYDEKTQTYSHTFAANKLSAGVEYKLKVTGGNWDYHCGTINGTIPGVLNDGEGNVCFTLKTVGDVTISFQDAKITVATTGEFKVPVTYEYYILGTMNSWSVKEDYGLADEDNDGIYTREITLTSGQHDFKINVGNWDSQWGWKDVEGNYSEATDAKDDNKIKITLTAEKTFTVLFNTSSKKITFEGLTQIHTVKATAKNGTVTGAGDYADGATATLTATAAEGYEFVSWTKGEEVVSTDNPYTFTVAADIALVANFVAVDYKDITFTVGKSGFTGVPQIKWWGAKGLEDAAEPVEMTAGQYSRYSYTFSNIDAITGVNFYIVLDGVQSKTITLHETPNTYSQFYTILQEVFVTLDGETEGVQLEGHPKAGYSSDYTKVNGVVQLPANTTKAFKLTVDGKDKGGNTIALTKDNLTANFTEDGEGNATIATELAGGYLFTYDYITKDVTVVYPFVGTMDLGQMTPSYSDESVTLKDDNNNEVTIYNVVEGEHTFGDNFDIEASVMHNGEWYTLTGKGSWTLADGVMTLVTTNLVDENNTVNYTITATALAPQEYTIACNGTYDEEVSAYYSSIKYAATTDEEDVIVIEIGVYGEETSASGQFNDNLFTTLTYTVEEGEDGVKVLTATATDEAGNTYHITITATKLVYPTVNIYGATATLDEEGTLTLSAEYKGKTVISEIWGYEGAGEYVWVGLVSTDYSFEWSANVVTVTEENGQYTITGVFLDDTDETKYNVTITTKATATALDNLNTTVAPVKMIENGQLIVIKNGVKYNAQGAILK